jgi:DNA polymerase
MSVAAVRRTLREVAAEAGGCRACPLWAPATQTVFGEGTVPAPLMLIGEQPGDQEDLAGHPFVGPAGRILDQALNAAGIDRRDVYLTNAVKHFKFERRGKRRLHARPNRGEIDACRPWLDRELELIHPDVLVLLGATAAQALLGQRFRVTQSRGVVPGAPFAPTVVATIHPSAVLRAPDHAARELQLEGLVQDLRAAAAALA